MPKKKKEKKDEKNKQKEIVFYDDFSSNKNGWGVGIDPDLSKKIVNGHYAIENKSSSTYWIWHEWVFPLFPADLLSERSS